MTVEPLSPDDARILALEGATVTGHTLKLIVLEPGAALDIERLRAAVEQRLPDQPRARQRVDSTGATPRWVDAEHFDIADHVRQHAAADTDADVRRIVGALMSEHLDRNRPLWTIDLIGPLADGREVIATRMHHAMVDGIAGMRFIESVLVEPHDAPLHPVGTRAAAAPLGRREEWLRMPGAVVRELGRPAGRSPFDRPITIARALAFASVPLSGLHAIGSSRPQHATVNDVLLAVIAGGLRTWLHGTHTVHGIRAQVPVSLHHRDEGHDSLGNRDSFLNVDLPLGEPDPLRRLDRLSAQTRVEKQHEDAELMYDLMHALGRFGRAGMLLDRAAGSAREFGVAVSNVPGPQTPIAVAGRPVKHLFSSSEPAPHHVLRISAISNADELGIGFCTDPTALPAVEELADDVLAAYDELHAAALGGKP